MRHGTNAYKILVRNPAKIDYFGHLGVDWRMIWMQQKWDVWWLDSSSSGYASLVGCYKHDHSGRLNCSNFLDQTSDDCQPLFTIFGVICYRCFAVCGALEAVAVIVVSSCSLHQNVRTSSGAHFYLRGTGGSFLGVKTAGTWSQPLVPI